MVVYREIGQLGYKISSKSEEEGSSKTAGMGTATSPAPAVMRVYNVR